MSFQLSANKRRLSAPDVTSLHHCLKNNSQTDMLSMVGIQVSIEEGVANLHD